LPAPAAGAHHHPGPLAVGPDSTLWYLDSGLQEVGHITTDGKATSFKPTQTVNSWNVLLSAGGKLWATSGYDDVLYSVTTTGTFSFYPANSGKVGTGPDFLAADQTYVYASLTVDPRIAHFKLASSAFTTPLTLQPATAHCTSNIVADSDGNFWFANYDGPSVFRLTPSGTATEYPLSSGQVPYSPAVAGDGNIWFLDGSRSLLRVTKQGALKSFTLPSYVRSSELAAGANHDLWIAAADSARVVRVDLSLL